MKNLRNIFMFALIALIVCCLFFNCCRIEGLENMKLEDTDVCQPFDEIACGNDPRCQWSGGSCVRNLLPEEDVPTPEGYSNY